ncbi:phage tail protein [Maridesulfovibrio sp. FT414]|uniref:phage tail protein n=1 Tax=Maridesulfovibrio sp. FT414 TaxID=2979469 RepID=UPI003D800222
MKAHLNRLITRVLLVLLVLTILAITFCAINMLGAISKALAGDATSYTLVDVQPQGLSDFPIGAVVPYSSGTVPAGWLECNGQSTAGHTELAAIVGANVPDLRGEFIRGWDHGRGVDPGRSLKSVQGQSFQSHSHPFTLYSMSGGSIPQGGYAEINMNWANGNNQAAYGHSTSSAGGTETRPRNYSMMYIIKAE